MRLLLIRHGAAVPRGTPGVRDAERALTPDGRRKFREAALGLARIVDRPDALLTSPLKRAVQTAEIAAAAWGRIAPRELTALATGAHDELARELEPFPGTATVALVGHEPHLSSLLARLVGARDPAALSFRKGGAALVEVVSPARGGGTLVWFAPQKLLRLLGGGAPRGRE